MYGVLAGQIIREMPSGWSMGMCVVILPRPQDEIPGGLVSHHHWHRGFCGARVMQAVRPATVDESLIFQVDGRRP